MDEMKKGVITLIDILGWKGIWTRNSDAILRLNQLINTIKVVVNEFKKNEFLNEDNFPNHFQGLETEVKSISDTIAIITYSEDANEALEYHANINAKIVADSIKYKIPVRGATSYGKLSSVGNIMVGPAVDEVASWYENTEWIGVIQTPTAMFLTDVSRFKYEGSILKKHLVKTKKNGMYDTYCVNWPAAWLIRENRDTLLKYFMEMGPITPDIAEKYISTLKFYDESNDELSKK